MYAIFRCVETYHFIFDIIAVYFETLVPLVYMTITPLYKVYFIAAGTIARHLFPFHGIYTALTTELLHLVK